MIHFAFLAGSCRLPNHHKQNEVIFGKSATLMHIVVSVGENE